MKMKKVWALANLSKLSGDIKYSKTRNAIKDLATNTRDKPSQIFAQVVSQCDDNVQDLLPREENPNSIPASNFSSPQ
jgi:hypothetical protein